MDRRTWLQLITILSAAREAHPHGRGGGTPPPMRVTKEKVTAALKLMGLEFQDAEIEIRPFFEAEDFGAEFTPELREQEERLRAQMEK